MKKIEILEHEHKYGACNEKGEPIIPVIYDSIEVCGDFVKVKIYGLYLLYTVEGKLLFKDMFKEIFIYTSYIACEQHEDEWVIYNKSLVCVDPKTYEDSYCDEKYLSVKENGCWRVWDKR